MRPWRFAMASLLAATSSSPSSSSSIDTVARKAAIRSQVKAALKTLTDTDIQERSAAVEAALHRMPEWGRSKVLCLYLSMTPEVQTYGCIQRAFGDGKRVFIPKVTGKRPEDMVMFELENYAAIDTFPKSKWGIPEPPLELVQRSVDGATLGAVDTVIVPLCAFDSLCGRVGHGKGYYGASVAASCIPATSCLLPDASALLHPDPHQTLL